MSEHDKDDSSENTISRRELAAKTAGAVAAVAVGASALSTTAGAAESRMMEAGPRALGRMERIELTNSTVGALRQAASAESNEAKAAIYRAALTDVGTRADGFSFGLSFGLSW